MTRHPILALIAAATSTFMAMVAHASGPSEWSQLNQTVESACLTAVGLADATVSSSPVHFSDTFGMDARLVTGRYPQAHMHGAHGTVLCLYDRRTRRAEAQEMAAASVYSPLQACYAQSANRIAVGPCLDRRLAKANAELSDAVGAAIERMHKLDAASGRALAAAALDRSQKAFSEFREANCNWLAAQMSAGTGSGDVARDCRIRMTSDRTQELRLSIKGPGRVADGARPPGA